MEYDVKIIRSARKSLSLTVSAENEITLRCPRGVSESRINAFLESKKGWLEKAVAQNEVKLSLNRSVLEYKEIYVGGKKLPLIISDVNKITENAVYVKNLKNVKSVFVSEFTDEFIRIAQKISEITGLSANGFYIRSYKRRWGSCDSRGIIKFNYMLFMLPPEVQRYVIVHELCHTVCFDHSKEFWRLVGKFEPDYKNLRFQLKRFDFITNLY